MTKSRFSKPKSDFVGNLEHHRGKKLSQRGAEFCHRLHEAHKRPTPLSKCPSKPPPNLTSAVRQPSIRASLTCFPSIHMSPLDVVEDFCLPIVRMEIRIRRECYLYKISLGASVLIRKNIEQQLQ